MYILHDISNHDKVTELSKQTLDKELGFSSWDNALQLIGLCIILILILIAAYYTSRFVGKVKLGQLKDSNFKVIDVYRISANKVLQIVKIADRYVVLGISKDQITYIMELDDSEVLIHKDKENDKQSFRQILEKIKGKKE
ncbi:MAG: flagellar biosynthetic protein FliO [Clostridiales bacterium]|nr:flagellar biosynthetic protein FliO [Clostridiales bacterium]